MFFLLHWPPIISFPLVSLFCALLAILILIIIRKMFPKTHSLEDHDFDDVMFNASSLIYAVLLAFVVFVTWGSYDTAKKNIELEASKLEAIFKDAGAFENPMKTNIRTAVAEYTRVVVDEEWPIMERGEKSTRSTRDALSNLWSVYTNVDIKTIKNLPMYEESLRGLNNIGELRRLRRFASTSSTPSVIWLVLIAGGVISIFSTYFIGTNKLLTKCFMTGVYTIMNSMVLLLIYVLDNPFIGHSAISSATFTRVLVIFKGVLRREGVVW